MAATKKTTAEPDEPFAEGGLVGDGTPQTVEVQAGELVLPAAASVAELVSDEQPLPGGFYINAGETDLVLLQPPKVLKPGRVIELEFGIRHRDLRLATDAEITAAREAEAAEQAAAAKAADTGQE